MPPSKQRALGAGEQGSGFAVVANEVRKLSEQARLATTRIDTALKLVSADVASTIGISKATAIVVNDGLKTSRCSSAIFEQIEQSTVTMHRSVKTVQEAADVQQLLARTVLTSIAENQARTDSVASMTTTCINETNHMIEAARNLNETTKHFQL